jgi:PAS domain S-box-containing protein
MNSIERKRAEGAQRISEERFRDLFDQSPIPVSIFSPDGRCLYYNKALQDRFGVVAEQLAGYNAMQDEQITDAGLMPYVRKAFTGEATSIPLMSFVSATSGNRYWLRAFAYPARDEAGVVTEVVSVFEDVTEQKEVEDSLRNKEAQYRAIFESTTDGLVINDMDGTVVEVNPAFCEMHGYTREELLGISPLEFIHPDYHSILGEYIETIRAGGSFQRHAVDLHKDGTPFHVEVHGSTFIFNGRPHILGVVRDITERVHSYTMLEERVEERTRELTTLLEISRNVASTLELEPLLGRILDQLKFVTEYSIAALLLKIGDQLVMLDSRGTPAPPEVAAGRQSPLQRFGIIWEMLSQGETVIIPDVQADTPLAAAFREAAGDALESSFGYIRSWLAVPLTLRDEVMGMLCLACNEPDCYTDQQAGLVLAIANHAAIGIANARLYRQAQETARLTAALEERQHLARELHDSVSQAIFSINLQTRTALTLLNRDPSKVEEPLNHVATLAQAAMAEMRALIFELRPESISTEGLVAALAKHSAALAARHGIEVQTRLGAEPRLSVEAKEIAYRVAQEASHNSIKHARASMLSFEMSNNAEWVTLEVGDNGIGFDASGNFPGHLGLRSMRERAAQVGGTLEIQSAPGEGTHVRLRLPVAGGPTVPSL